MDRDTSAARTYAITGALWAVSASASVLLAMRNLSEGDREYFQGFWAEGFMPVPPKSLGDVIWLFNKLLWAFGSFASGLGLTTGGLNYRWSVVFAITMFVGLWACWNSKRDRAVTLFIALPVVTVAILSAARVYPLTARLFTFLLPGLLLATAAGADYILSNWPARAQSLTPVFLAVLSGSPIYAVATALPPYWLQHLRPIIERVSATSTPTDAIYVYYGAGQAFHYYAGRYRLPNDHVIMGTCSIGTPRAYLRDLDQLRGQPRVWILLTHDTRGGKETKLIVDYLDRIGRRLDEVVVPGTGRRAIEEASGFLYDLSAPRKLAAASSATFPVPADPNTTSWPQCHGVMLSESP
jgi:hypothetical protein